MEAKTTTIKSIVDRVKHSAQSGNACYMHQHVGGALTTLFPDPHELVARLREILVDVDVEYAEPYVSIRW